MNQVKTQEEIDSWQRYRLIWDSQCSCSHKGKGVVNEPAVVAVDTRTHEVLAVGEEAYLMVGRTPGNIKAIRPLKGGVIADFDITEAMLAYFIDKINVKFYQNQILLFVPQPTLQPLNKRQSLKWLKKLW